MAPRAIRLWHDTWTCGAPGVDPNMRQAWEAARGCRFPAFTEAVQGCGRQFVINAILGLEALAAEAQALQLDTSAATMSVAELEAALPRLQTELSMARDEAASAGAAAAAGAADADAMLAQLHAAQTEAGQLDAALSEARADLAKPVQQSRAFLSMRASLQEKNGVAKALQEKVKAHGLANDIEATED